jgi:hypothetical protein
MSIKNVGNDPQENTLVINIDLNRRVAVVLSLVLVALIAFGYFAWSGGAAIAANPEAPQAVNAGERQFYLTKNTYIGREAPDACEKGYHFASLWEILDPSNFKYNTTLGQERPDSGSGPVTYRGWIRTGYTNNSDNTVGRANCMGWNNIMGYGTTVQLPNTWDAGWSDIHIWSANIYTCGEANRVWCVED